MGKKRKKQKRALAAGTGSVPLRSRNIEKLAKNLFPDDALRERFLNALTIDSSRRAVVWVHSSSQENRQNFFEGARAPWTPDFIQLPDPAERPGASKVHEQGEIYCLDLSSVFAAVPLAITGTQPRLVIDMCAAPGGKGILAWRSVQPEAIVFNEVIRKRTAQLISNVRRCRLPSATVTSNDPRDLGAVYHRAADVVIVDAPCSGQSLLARNLSAPGAFHPATISANAQRQRRILAHSQECVRVGGYLLYSTCTFSPEENEETVRWFLTRFPQFVLCEVPQLEQFKSNVDASLGYRLFPHLGFGAGAFCALLRLTEETTTPDRTETSIAPLRVVFSSPKEMTAFDGISG